MSKSFLIGASSGGTTQTDNLTRYYAPTRISPAQTADDDASQMPVRLAGVFANLFTYCASNTVSVNSTVITLQLNGAGTAVTVSYGSDQTGVKEDTTHTVSAAATDELNYEIVTPSEAGTNTFTINIIKAEFTPTDTTKCWQLMGCVQSNGFSTDSTSFYMVPLSNVNGSNTTETNAKYRIRQSVTSSNLYSHVVTNTRTTNVVVRSRVNAGNGNQLLTYTSTQTGVKEDTTNTDVLVIGNDFDYVVTTLTGGNTTTFTHISSQFISTGTNTFPLVAGGNGGQTVAFNNTNYLSITGGSPNPNATEANAECLPRFTFNAFEFEVLVTANTITTSPTTIAVRDNQATSSLSLSYNAAQTGLKNDSTNKVVFTSGTDEISYIIITPNTSGNFTFTWAGVLGSTDGIVFDAASNSGYNTADNSYTWSHTCTGLDRYLVVGVSMLSIGGSSVTAITYNGVALTKIGSVASVSGAVRMELWGLANPTLGANTIQVDLSASLDSIGGASSFGGVHQTSPYEGFNSASATNVGAADATVNVTTVADNDWVVDTVATDDTAITVGAGQTSRWNVTGTLGSGAGSTEGPKTPAGSVTMSWANVGALATWSIGAVALRPVAASDLSSIKTIDGLAKASVKTVDGLAIASVKTFDGLA